uniref:Ribosomal protein S19 n=1 Tax=Stylonychia lemnae TaxID=5949 RepID=A0A3S6K748_STYLE|nr:ribosomal protein S19 [Stylonychia lemnae]
MVFKMGKKKIFNRSSVIPFSFKNIKVTIYSGKKWFDRLLNIWSVGFKFGELTWNRRLALYKAKQLKKKKKK